MFDHDHLILCRARQETPPGKTNSEPIRKAEPGWLGLEQSEDPVFSHLGHPGAPGPQPPPGSFSDRLLARRAFEEELLRALPPGESLSVTVVPHLYDLTADGPVLRRLRSLSGRLVVLAWLPSRATYWILRNAGVADARSGDSRKIRCLDLRDYGRPEACVEAICRITSAAAEPGATATDKPPNVEQLEGSVSARWYPVIDYDRCANCLECLNFCLFGVFGLDASGTVQVEQPDACRPGCPACARVCPSEAIMFPEHSDPAISGVALGKPVGSEEGTSPLLPIIDPFRLAVNEREGSKSTKSVHPLAKSASTTDRDAPAEEDTRLDNLIDELDEFDL